jgi:hypothetical protein
MTSSSPGYPCDDGAPRCYEDLSGFDGAVKIGEATAGTTITARGNWVGAPVVIGTVYEFRFILSGFRPQNPGNGLTAPNRSKARVRRAWIRYHNTYFFKITVRAERRPPSIYEFDGTILDSRASQVGSELGQGLDIDDPALFEGVYQFPVLSDGSRVQVELSSDAAVPCNFLSVEWVGTTNRATLT